MIPANLSQPDLAHLSEASDQIDEVPPPDTNHGNDLSTGTPSNEVDNDISFGTPVQMPTVEVPPSQHESSSEGDVSTLLPRVVVEIVSWRSPSKISPIICLSGPRNPLRISERG